MHQGFWPQLEWPVIGLAPMDGVTDAAFRYIMACYGKPALLFTEFTSVEGIRAGAERLLDDFLYSPIEHPIVGQLFGSDPAAFYIGAGVVAALGFDGIDINMGCPAKNVTQHGAGAALIQDPKRAQAIIRQAQAGAKAWASGATLVEMSVPEKIIALVEKRRNQLQLTQDRVLLPVSVKTRLGYSQVSIAEWIPQLLEVEPCTISLHGRTLKQGYSGEANWQAIAEASQIVHQANTGTRILGNGDVGSLSDAHNKITDFGVDGVLIGRAAFGNPWLFTATEPILSERKLVALEHARYLDTLVTGKGFLRMRKHLLDYIKGSEGAKELRTQLMRVENLQDVERILADTP